MLQIVTIALRVARFQLSDAPGAQLVETLDDAQAAIDRANLLAHRLGRRVAPDSSAKPVFLQLLVPGLRAILCRALGEGIRLEILVAESLARVLCDDHELEDALLNLAVNARDAMPDGGTVVIEAAPCASGHGDGCIALSVTDTGPGMPSGIADRAFSPFFTTKRACGNSGLGLANVRQFAEQAGGSAELLAPSANGALVRMHLPSIAQGGNA
jgi:signal transduction histidine kinase